MPGIFDDDELDALEGDSSNPEEHDDPQGPRGDGPDADASESGGDPVAELKRKLAEERGTNEELMVRLARVEGMLAGTPAKPADPEKETKFSVESLAEHAAGGGKEAFEAAVAYLKQEEGNFRERILKELKGNQAQEDTRSELEAMLPGISNPRSAAFKAVEVEQAKILSRRPSLDTNRAWDLAVVAVARTQGAGAAGPAYSRDRRANTSAASGAASGGDRDPGSKQTFEFTNEDEAVLRRMKPDSRVFSKDPKVRAAARRTFVKLKANIASRSQSASYTRNRSNGG